VPFRWTASPSISWKDFYPLQKKVTIKIPVVNQIFESFARDCLIFLNGNALETSFDGRDITALVETKSSNEMFRVELKTPPPKTPRELNGIEDDRRLGIAVRA
jgi:hypothetical protein